MQPPAAKYVRVSINECPLLVEAISVLLITSNFARIRPPGEEAS